jgi:hypothetical protein
VIGDEAEGTGVEAEGAGVDLVRGGVEGVSSKWSSRLSMYCAVRCRLIKLTVFMRCEEKGTEASSR